MGSSLALALRKNGYAGPLTGYDANAVAGQEALTRQVISDVAASPAEAAERASLVVLAAPVLANAAMGEALSGRLSADTVVTDMGSTKSVICARLSAAGVTFVGSHPVAGSEKRGGGAARADLFEGRRVVVTPPAGVPEDAVALVEALWKTVGARPVRMTPEAHDRMLARTSHLPHLVAAALATAMGRDHAREVGPFCGTGFYDSTRVASGSVEMWKDILATNRPAIEGELRAFKSELDALYTDIQSGDEFAWVRFLERAQASRAALLEGQRLAGDAASTRFDNPNIS